MRLKAVVSYDGTRYRGWQRQENANSIQSEIESMLSKLHKHPIEIVASGRTDAQVHAIGQVFHFDSDKEIDCDHWKQAMNSMLPKDIRIQSIEQVDDHFHARFSATSKRYDYLVTNRKDDPFIQSYMSIERQQLDVSYMKRCACIFIGTHDFTSFTSAKIDIRKPRVKTVTNIEIVEHDAHIQMIFEGSGFLRYMVRMLAQTLIEAGKHKVTYEEIETILKAKDKHVCRFKAEACGLYLMHVTYGG